METTTILEYLRDKRILSVTPHKDVFKFSEASDEYYFALLTKDQMRQLIAERQELVDRSKEPQKIYASMPGAILQSWRGHFDAGEVVSPDGANINLTIPCQGNRSICLSHHGDDSIRIEGETQIIEDGRLFSHIIKPQGLHNHMKYLADWNMSEVNMYQEAWIRDLTNKRAYTLRVAIGSEYKGNYFNLIETQC